MLRQGMRSEGSGSGTLSANRRYLASSGGNRRWVGDMNFGQPGTLWKASLPLGLSGEGRTASFVSDEGPGFTMCFSGAVTCSLLQLPAGLQMVSQAECGVRDRGGALYPRIGVIRRHLAVSGVREIGDPVESVPTGAGGNAVGSVLTGVFFLMHGAGGHNSIFNFGGCDPQGCNTHPYIVRMLREAIFPFGGEILVKKFFGWSVSVA
jgi:hypothetical protein